MRVVLDRKMVINHVMRYPGEVVELPDPPAPSGPVASEDATSSTLPVASEDATSSDDAPKRRRKAAEG